MRSTPAIYRAAARVASGLAPALSLLSPKLAAGHRERQGAVERLSAWASRSRDPARPLVWFHASSVGEGLQAESVLHELRRRRPAAQYVYTHFSPSAASLARRLPVDVADYLPYDLPRPVETLLGSLAPDLLVFSKLDLWPELAVRAAAGGTAVAIVAATVSPGSGRLGWPARSLLRAGYAAVAAAAAVSDEDAERLARLGVFPERIRVLGDPRYDSVMEKIAGVSEEEPLLRFGRGVPTRCANRLTRSSSIIQRIARTGSSGAPVSATAARSCSYSAVTAAICSIPSASRAAFAGSFSSRCAIAAR